MLLLLLLLLSANVTSQLSKWLRPAIRAYPSVAAAVSTASDFFGSNQVRACVRACECVCVCVCVCVRMYCMWVVCVRVLCLCVRVSNVTLCVGVHVFPPRGG